MPYKDPEKGKAYKRQYYLENKESINRKNRANWKKNKDRYNKKALETRKKNIERKSKYDAEYRLREGYCVYKAIFRQGVYIGSGQTARRRIAHMGGTSTIGRTQGKATSFDVLFIGTKESCMEIEDLIISSYGFENLLNVHRAIRS